jgi:hypothetical protein
MPAPLTWPEAIRKLPEPWATFLEGSSLAGPTPEGVCLLIVDPKLLPLLNSLSVARHSLAAARMVSVGVTGVVVVDKERYQAVLDNTVEVVGVRTDRPGRES